MQNGNNSNVPNNLPSGKKGKKKSKTARKNSSSSRVGTVSTGGGSRV